MTRRILLGAVVLAFGCGGGERAPAGEAAAGGAEAQGPRGAASIVGVVSFQGSAPANPTIDMAEEPFCRARYEAAPEDPQVVVSDGKLANVFVYLKGGLPEGASYTPPTTPVVLDQQGCLYHPRVFGAMAGQPLEIRNSDSLLHNIKAVPQAQRGFNISQPVAGMAMTRTFNAPEVMVPFECNVHGWMHAYVGVLPHPFFATSAGDGAFTIERVPPGTYELEAWHEKLGARTATVTVPDSGAVRVEFTFGAAAT